MTKILVTGATGGLGSQVVEFLLQRLPAKDIAALARDPAKLKSSAEKGVDVRVGDYVDPGTLERAFAGVERVLLVSAPAFSDATTQHRNVINAARRSGVRHLYYVSLQRPEGSTVEIPMVTQWEAETEALVQASGLDWTILRNTMYFDTLPLGGNVLNDGIKVPAGNGVGAFASRRDLAEGAAAVLSGDGHQGKIYTLTGGESVSMADIAAAMSDAYGRSIMYQDTSVEQFVTARMKEGWPEAGAAFAAAWFQAIAKGEYAEVTNDLERFLGRLPQTAREFFVEAARGFSDSSHGD